jgi:hypothetical protein
MSLRISSALGLLIALSACGAETSPTAPTPGEPTEVEDAGAAIDCAIAGVADLSPVCTLELAAASGEVIIHHPDGGFRRIGRDAQSGALIPLDGAELLVPEEAGTDLLAFAIGSDRYRFPSTLLDPPAR